MTTDSLKLSIAFFTYNQEAYVREAVKSLLNQETTEPLEIILSDDCSPDGTFAILKEEVDAYSGGHQVILRRNESNLGLAKHLNLVFQLCSGEWIMVAAGDDVSELNRATEVLGFIESSQNDQLVAIQSGYTDIRPDGSVIRTTHDAPLPTKSLVDYIESDAFIVGAVMTYRRDLVFSFPVLLADTRYEDRVFGFRAILLGQLMNVNQALVRYRRFSPNSLSSGGDYDSLSEIEKWDFQVKRYTGLAMVNEQQIIDLEQCGLSDSEVIAAAYRQNLINLGHASAYSGSLWFTLIYSSRALFLGYSVMRFLRITKLVMRIWWVRLRHKS